MFEVARLHVRQVIAGPRLWVLGLAMAAPIALIALIAANAPTGPGSEQIAPIVLFVAYPVGLTSLSAMLLGTSLLSAEVQDQTATYLFTRAVSRTRIVVEKYLANVFLLGTATLVSLLVSWLLIAPGRTDVLFGIGGSVVISTFAYNAAFALIGSFRLFQRKPLIAGFTWFATLEIVPALVPAFIRSFTVMYYSRCFALQVIGVEQIPPEMLPIIGDATITDSLTVVGIATVVVLGLTCLIATNREFQLTDEP